MRLRLNPDIQRYIWLEFSWHRLMIMPIILAIIFAIAHKVGADQMMNQTIARCAGWLYVIMAIFWGGQKVANSVLEEVNNQTWDLQRLSRQSSWNLTWGKLLGSPIYAWYGAFIALGVYSYTSSMFEDTSWIIYKVFLLILITLISHASSLFVSLLTIDQRHTVRGKSTLIMAQALGLMFPMVFYWTHSFKLVGGFNALEAPNVDWFGLSFSYVGFELFALVSVCGWFILGINQLMKNQLKMPCNPWLWLSFTAYWILFFIGYVFPIQSFGIDKDIYFFSIIGILVASICMYIIAFVQSWGPLDYRTAIGHWYANRHAKFLQRLPRWLLSLVLLLAVILIGFIAGCSLNVSFALKGLVVMLILLSFALRDIFILHFFRFSPKGGQHAVATTLIYLLLLYVLLPALQIVIHAPDNALLLLPIPSIPHGRETFMEVFGVSISDISKLGTSLAQTGFAGFLAWFRWDRHWSIHRKM